MAGKKWIHGSFPSLCWSAQLASCMQDYTLLFNPLSEHFSL